jgi:hypothetical protein
MKKFYFLFSFVHLCLNSYSQQITGLEKSLDSLVKLKAVYYTKLVELDYEYSRIEKLLNQKRFEESIGTTYICDENTFIYKSRGDTTHLVVIDSIDSGSKVKVIGREEQYDEYGQRLYNVVYKNVTGWMSELALVTEEDYKKEINGEDLIKISEDDNENEYKSRFTMKCEFPAERKVRLLRTYGSPVAEKILTRETWKGMTYDMAIESWGPPFYLYRFQDSCRVKEQWVYENTCLNFENGLLTIRWCGDDDK